MAGDSSDAGHLLAARPSPRPAPAKLRCVGFQPSQSSSPRSVMHLAAEPASPCSSGRAATSPSHLSQALRQSPAALPRLAVAPTSSSRRAPGKLALQKSRTAVDIQQPAATVARRDDSAAASSAASSAGSQPLLIPW